MITGFKPESKRMDSTGNIPAGTYFIYRPIHTEMVYLSTDSDPSKY